MNKSESKCEICGVTHETCGTFFQCPMFRKKKNGEAKLVCHKCHEKCPNHKIYNGYMGKCTFNEADGA